MTEETTSHFVPFPQEKVNQQVALEQRRKPGTVINPHHPDPSKRVSSREGVAAMGMALATHAGEPAQPQMGLRIPPGGYPAAQPIQASHYQQPVAQQAMSAPVAYEPQQAYVPVRPVSEAEALSFGLPSQFLIYEGNITDLYIMPFKGRNFAKLARAREEESLLHLVEAVASVTTTSTGNNAVAFDLSLPDFFACLYWLRMNSFMKHSFVHKTTCRSVKHHDWIQNGRVMEDGSKVEVPRETLQHAETITKSMMKTRMLERLPDPADYPLDNPNIRLVYVPMREVLELTMNDSLDPFVARVATSFQPIGQSVSLQERMQMVDDLSADDIMTIDKWEHDIANYGVEESLQWTCKTCGHVHTDELRVEAHSFFPSAA